MKEAHQSESYLKLSVLVFSFFFLINVPIAFSCKKKRCLHVEQYGSLLVLNCNTLNPQKIPLLPTSCAAIFSVAPQLSLKTAVQEATYSPPPFQFSSMGSYRYPAHLSPSFFLHSLSSPLWVEVLMMPSTFFFHFCIHPFQFFSVDSGSTHTQTISLLSPFLLCGFRSLPDSNSCFFERRENHPKFNYMYRLSIHCINKYAECCKGMYWMTFLSVSPLSKCSKHHLTHSLCCSAHPNINLSLTQSMFNCYIDADQH